MRWLGGKYEFNIILIFFLFNIMQLIVYIHRYTCTTKPPTYILHIYELLVGAEIIYSYKMIVLGYTYVYRMLIIMYIQRAEIHFLSTLQYKLWSPFHMEENCKLRDNIFITKFTGTCILFTPYYVIYVMWICVQQSIHIPMPSLLILNEG